jgi:hypothetical protein
VSSAVGYEPVMGEPDEASCERWLAHPAYARYLALRDRAMLAPYARQIEEMAAWMRANLTYQGPNGTDRCHTCRADLGGEYREALPHKPGCHAASLLERAGALAEPQP